MWSIKLFIGLVTIFVITEAGSSQSRGMPAGHPFQGSQPKHLDTLQKPKGPRRPTSPRRKIPTNLTPALPKSMTDENNYDTDKMMRYDDFSNEDIGNIIMDAIPESELDQLDNEPEYIPLNSPPHQLPPNIPTVPLGIKDPEGPTINNFRHQQLPKINMKDEIRESNSLPGIKEFDEFPFFGTTPSHIVDGATLVSAGNRPFLYRTRLGPQRNFRRGLRRPLNNGQQRLIRQPNFPVRRYPAPNLRQNQQQQQQFRGVGNGGSGNRHQNQAAGGVRKPQVSLHDTFDYEDFTDINFDNNEDINAGEEYYDDEIVYSELDQSDLPPKKYKIVRHGANLGNPGGNLGHNNQHHDIIDSVHHEDVNFPKIPPPQYSGNSQKGQGFFNMPDNFPTLHELAGGGFNRRNHENNFSFHQQQQQHDQPLNNNRNRRRRRLLIALDKDYIQSQRLLSQRL